MLHTQQINNFLLYSDRYVFSNCSDGKVFHWEIVDQDKPTGRAEYPVTVNPKEFYDQCFAHENAKPYTSFVYDDQEDIFVSSMYEK